MERWSFQSQVFFLGKRLEHHRKLVDYPGSVVQDRTVYEDAEIFASNLYQQGQMSQRDYETYRSLYEAISAFLPAPDLIIYLKASQETLLRHIRQRGRAFEQTIDPNYIRQLNVLYEQWSGQWSACPVLTIDMDVVDFQSQPSDFDEIVREVDTKLSQHITP